jgi:hypothetical protein
MSLLMVISACKRQQNSYELIILFGYTGKWVRVHGYHTQTRCTRRV